MNKKQAGRRPEQNPAERGPGNYDPSKPESGRRTPKLSEDRKGFGKPEGHPIDKQAPNPGPEGGGKDILDGERSDRDSGRPVQLEDDDESQIVSPGQRGRADSEPGLGGRPQGGRENRKPREAEKTKR